MPTLEAILLGAFVSFFDTLGIGSLRADHRLAEVPRSSFPIG